jgi:hypothetical protein
VNDGDNRRVNQKGKDGELSKAFLLFFYNSDPSAADEPFHLPQV